LFRSISDAACLECIQYSDMMKRVNRAKRLGITHRKFF